MYYEMKTITPEIAEEMLERNVRNRKPNRERIRMITNDIKEGKWTESPSPISFDSDGNLLDGQHRLMAIRQAGIPVITSIAYDVHKDAVIDKTLERSTGDSLYMRGLIKQEMAHKDVIAIVNRYLDNIEGVNAKSVSDNKKAEFINRYERELNETILITGSSKLLLSRKAAVRTAIFSAVVAGVDTEKLREFCEVLNTGFMANPNQSAAVVLRNYLFDEPAYGWAASNRIVVFSEMAIKDFVSEIPRRNRYAKKGHVYINSNSFVW